MNNVTLYKRNAKNDIIVWRINELADGTLSIAHGLYGHSSIVEFIKPTMKKANELQSRVNAKRKEGYKELSELNSIIDAYLASIGNPQMPIKMKSGVANVSLYKIVMLAVMGLSDVFVRGGQIIVDETDEGLSFEAVSDFELSASKLENINKAIKGVLPDDNPALLAPIVYLSSLINEVGVKLILEYQTKRAVLSVR